MSKSKNISLTLKQAILADGINSTLQNLLEALFKSLPQVAQRIEHVDFVSEIVLARLEQHPTNEGLYLRAFIFEHGAMGMVDFAAEGAFCDLVAMLPPKGQKFLKREIVIYIKDNKILAYGMRGANATFSRVLGIFLYRIGITSTPSPISIEDIPSRATVQQLRDIGVKSIDVSITDYLENLPGADNLPSVFRSILAKPLRQEDVRKRQNAVGRLKLTRGRFLKSERVEKDEYLTEIGERIFESDFSDDYTIILENGRALRPSNLKVVRTYEVESFANSISYPQVKLAAADFARHLSASGEW